MLAAYALGAWLADSLGSRAAPLLMLIAACGLCALLARRAAPAFILMFAAAGGLHLLARTLPFMPEDLRHLAGSRPALAEVRGRLAAPPRQSAFLRRQEMVVHSMAEIELSAIRLDRGPWQPARGRILATAPNLPEGLHPPQELEVAGALAPPPGPMADGMFDYAAYLRRKGIHYRLKTDSAQDWVLTGPKVPAGLSERFLAWARQTLSRGLSENDTATRLLWSITLGVQEELPGEVFEPFMISGTMHVFAISGLHVALFGGVILSVLQLARMPRAAASLVMIAALWGYTAATGWQPSAIRATVMMSILAGGWILWRPANLLNSLFAAALLIALCDPRQFFGASFQLSFCAVLSIAILVPWFDKRRDRAVDKCLGIDPLVPEAVIPPGRMWWRRASRGLWSFASVSVAAALGSLPLVAHYFHLASWLSILTNLAVVPLSSLALAANVGSLALFFTPLCPTLNHCAWALMRAMEWASSLAASQTWGFWNVPSIPPAAVMLCYVGLFSFFGADLLPARLRRVFLTIAGTGLFGLVAAALPSLRTVNITAMPLRGGMSVFVDAPGRSRDLLLDTGDGESAENILRPFLKAQGVNSLTALALTHGDVRHVGGAPLIRQTFGARRVLASPLRFRSSPYRAVMAQFESLPGGVRFTHSGMPMGDWRVLHPGAEDKFPKADDGALVLLGDFFGTRLLLLSDLGGEGQARLLERHGESLAADVVIAGLAADGSALGSSLLDAARPRLLVVCDSKEPSREEAKSALKARLRAAGPTVWFTSESGVVTLSLGPEGWRARSQNGFETKAAASRAARTGDPHPAGRLKAAASSAKVWQAAEANRPHHELRWDVRSCWKVHRLFW